MLRAAPGADAAFDLGQRLCEAVVPRSRPRRRPPASPTWAASTGSRTPRDDGDDGVRGRTTDPEFVRGVVRCLKARGHDRITIAEGWGATHKDWERARATSPGYAAMAREEHVPLVAMDDDGVFDVEGDQPGKPLGIRGMESDARAHAALAQAARRHLAHGLFLSLPKIKAHRFGVSSMAMKGMQGTVMLSDKSPAFQQKWRMHRELNPYLDARKSGRPKTARRTWPHRDLRRAHGRRARD